MTLPAVYETYPAISPEKYKGKLKGKVVAVTGSSSGIGAATARAFAAAGSSVAAIARRENKLNTVVESIRSAGGKAIAIQADITDRSKPHQELISRIEKSLGPVDILICNAGVMRVSPLTGEPEDLDIWWKVFETNVRAPVALVRAVLPSMIERKSGIVMRTTSKLAALDFPAMTAYVSSKAAITKFHAALAVELEDTNVLSFTVDPGQVNTGIAATPTACNLAEMEHPAMQSLFQMVGSVSQYQSPDLCADTMVALAANSEAKVLNGHFVSANQDLSKILEEASKEGKGRVGKENLYSINIPTL